MDNTRIWKDPNTAKGLGYSEVKRRYLPIIKSDDISTNFKKCLRTDGKKTRVLDIGGGNGRKYYDIADLFETEDFEYTVIDINPECLKTGRDHFKDKTNVSFIELDVNTNDWDKELKKTSFDVCIFDSTLNYINYPKQTLDKVINFCDALLLTRVKSIVPHVTETMGVNLWKWRQVSLSQSAHWEGYDGHTWLFGVELYSYLLTHPQTTMFRNEVELAVDSYIHYVGNLPMDCYDDQPWRKIPQEEKHQQALRLYNESVIQILHRNLFRATNRPMPVIHGDEGYEDHPCVEIMAEYFLRFDHENTPS